MFPNAEVMNTSGQKASGDFIMKRIDRPSILFENKEYDYNIPKDEIAKFIRDVDSQDVNGIFISQNSGITFKQNFQIDVHKGNILVYIQNCEYSTDKIKMAVDIIDNAKTQRPSTCNAAETLLIDRAVADRILPSIAARLATKKVELRADPEALDLLAALPEPYPGTLVEALDEYYYLEYNDYILNIRLVDDVTAAIDHIRKYGSAHSDTIVTANEVVARRFLAEVDSAAVYWNASTRFTDGGEFGMGAEIGISPDKLHARGPMGLDELCSYKWLGWGTGQVRG
jgi:glutamate-5-semialdehyde dehydrogenase